MEQKHLFPIIQEKVQNLLNDYLAVSEITKEIETFIVPPALGDQAGMLGALALASKAASR